MGDGRADGRPVSGCGDWWTQRRMLRQRISWMQQLLKPSRPSHLSQHHLSATTESTTATEAANAATASCCSRWLPLTLGR